MPKLRLVAAGLTASLLTLTLTAPVLAQVTTGTLVGTVRDPNGIVPGATVMTREQNRGTSDTVVTDETGSYTAPFLTPGPTASRSMCPASRSGSGKAW